MRKDTGKPKTNDPGASQTAPRAKKKIKNNAIGNDVSILGTIRSRIVAHTDEDPASLIVHPLNFRRHPATQISALKGSMRELGWLKGVIVNRTTGRIVDGHARCEEAIKQNISVPVDWVELDENEERLALAVLDPITELAERELPKLAELVDQITASDSDLQKLLNSMIGSGNTTSGSSDQSGSIDSKFQILINCSNENVQADLLFKLTEEGYECRSLIS